MRNPTTTTQQYTMQLTLPLGDLEEKIVSKRNLAPTFQVYDNKQAQMILDLELFIPAHHVARVIDEMIEAIPDEQLFAHYTGGGRRWRPQFLPSQNDAQSHSVRILAKGLLLPRYRKATARKSPGDVAGCDAAAGLPHLE
ncbi:hypothetical protein ACHHV8_02810 [Paenibacillus sp. TAB 01]|uniref:hypothetical protein n=1 Tax=Paenibacillus sp. TAB 01 TaxID=3368988 RepID=UPI003750364A